MSQENQSESTGEKLMEMLSEEIHKYVTQFYSSGKKVNDEDLDQMRTLAKRFLIQYVKENPSVIIDINGQRFLPSEIEIYLWRGIDNGIQIILSPPSGPLEEWSNEEILEYLINATHDAVEIRFGGIKQRSEIHDMVDTMQKILLTRLKEV